MIDINTTTDEPTCVRLEFNNVKTSEGTIDLQQIKAGDFTMVDTQIGNDSDLNDSDLTFATTTKYQVLNNGIVDRAVTTQ